MQHTSDGILVLYLVLWREWAGAIDMTKLAGRWKIHPYCVLKSASCIFPTGSVVLWLLSQAQHPSNGQHGPHSAPVESLRSLEADGPAHRPHHFNPRRGHCQGDGADIQLLPRLGKSACFQEHLTSWKDWLSSASVLMQGKPQSSISLQDVSYNLN